jgi:hypothetical protein
VAFQPVIGHPGLGGQRPRQVPGVMRKTGLGLPFASMVRRPEEWSWSSYRATAAEEAAPRRFPAMPSAPRRKRIRVDPQPAPSRFSLRFQRQQASIIAVLAIDPRQPAPRLFGLHIHFHVIWTTLFIIRLLITTINRTTK